MRKKLYFSVHFSFLILLALSIIFRLFPLFLSYFICLILHEGMHALVSKKLGYRIGKIKLLATGAVLEAQSDEFTFKDEIKIALAGPLFNLFISIILLASWWIVPEGYNFTLDLFVINLAIFMFNMLPIFPLDGGRVLLAFLSMKTERKTAVKVCKIITIIFSILLFCLFLVTFLFKPNFSLGVMSVNLFLGAVVEDKNAIYKRVISLKSKSLRLKKGLEVRQVCVRSDESVLKLYSLLDERHYTIFVLFDENFKPVKTLTEAEVLSLIMNEKILPLGKD